MRGERTPSSLKKLHKNGLSPHALGALIDHLSEGSTERIIPAYAGNTMPRMCGCSLGRDHPRMCGEHAGNSIE